MRNRERGVSSNNLKNVLVVFGTRPEAIKMAPVVAELRKSDKFSVRICVTAQHREMLDDVLVLFKLVPDHDLNLMVPNQSLDALSARCLMGVGEVLDFEKPDLVLVHGDTTTTLAAALAAFYRQIPLGHVEAGLRSHNMMAPWPEEMNRRITTLTAQFHFAPTTRARDNLIAEGVRESSIHQTGNTVIDALVQTSDRTKKHSDRSTEYKRKFDYLAADRDIVLVTAHRRENFGPGFEAIAEAINQLVREYGVQVVYPVHPNPNVREAMLGRLGRTNHIHLVEPLDYAAFVYLMDKSKIVLTDSGGIQEEAPALGKPVLVLREVTERPEAVEAGTVILVGTSKEKIVAEAGRLLSDQAHYFGMARTLNPYGDGHASQRIRAILEAELFAG